MYATATLAENRVFRNTFLLVGLSLVPTILGVLFAQYSGFNAWMEQHVVVGIIVMLAALFGSMLITAALSNSSGVGGIAGMLFFSLVMGFMMSSAIYHVAALKHGPMILVEALAGTIITCVGCSVYAMTTKRDFSSWGAGLAGILLALICLMFLNLFLNLPWLTVALSAVGLVLFSAYLIYDVQQVIRGGETNYILAAMSIYLDIVNIFMSLLQLLTSLDNDD